MEQEHFDPDFQELYDHYIRSEEKMSQEAYRQTAPDIRMPEPRKVRWWLPAAAAILLILVSVTWAVRSDWDPFRQKQKYTDAEIRESLQKTMHALSKCSKTVREEFGRVEDLAAMTNAIKPGKKTQDRNGLKNETNTSKY